MKRFFLKILPLLMVSLIFLPGPVFAEFIEAQTGVHLDWWKNSLGDRGLQVVTPITATLFHGDFSAIVLGGYAYSETHVADNGTESISHALDTKVNLAYQVIDKLPIDMLVSLGFNLPTGATKLREEQLAVIMDPDLVSIVTFGEGFNVNPVVVFSKRFGDLVAGLGAGYTFRGEYDISEEALDYQPGNVFSISPQIRYFISDRWLATLFGNFTRYDKDKLAGEEFLQQGDSYLAGVGINYAQQRWAVGANIFGVLRNDTKVLERTVEQLVISAVNFNTGNQIGGEVSFGYTLDELTTFNSQLRVVHYDQAASDLVSTFLLGNREVYSLRASVERKLISNLSGEVSAKGFFIPDALIRFHPETSSDHGGFALAAMLTGRF